MGQGHHHSSGESHRHQRDRQHKHRHHGAVPVGRPHAPPNGQPVVGKLVEDAPKDWSRRKHRRHGSNRFWNATSLITTFAFVIFAVGCMAGGWLLMRNVLGSHDSAKITGTEVAKNDTKNETKKNESSSPTKPAEQPKPTVAETKPAPTPPPTKAEPPKMVETKPDPPKPVETKPAPKPAEPPKEPAKEPVKTDPSAPLVSYDKDIRVIMESKCNRCHGDTAKPKGGLDTRTLASILKGGKEDGPGVTPGAPDKSSIWKSIESGDMPPKGEPKLTDDQKKLILNWIKGGAKATATAAAPAPAPAAPAGGAALAYEKHVLPILTAKCGKCHDSTNLKGGVDVTSLAALKKGGTSGFPGVVAGDLKKSEIWQQIDSGNMPQGDNPKLTAAEMETIKNWIMMGAKDNKMAMVASAK